MEADKTKASVHVLLYPNTAASLNYSAFSLWENVTGPRNSSPLCEGWVGEGLSCPLLTPFRVVWVFV